MALMYSNGMKPGTPAPSFSLRGVDPATHCPRAQSFTLDEFASAPVVVIIFTCNHCPYAKACEDRLIAIQEDYRARGVQLLAINPNDAARYPDDSFEAMAARSAEKSYNFPYLCDDTQEVARAYDAACTPDVFVFGASRTLVYNGRIDDNWQHPEEVTQRDLRHVLDATLADKEHGLDVKPSMGCSIKWKS